MFGFDLVKVRVLDGFPPHQLGVLLQEFLPVTTHILHSKVIHDKLVTSVGEGGKEMVTNKAVCLSSIPPLLPSRVGIWLRGPLGVRLELLHPQRGINSRTILHLWFTCPQFPWRPHRLLVQSPRDPCQYKSIWLMNIGAKKGRYREARVDMEWPGNRRVEIRRADHKMYGLERLTRSKGNV